MATYVEMIYPKTRECVVLADGVIVERYEIDHCDKCDSWQGADQQGFQKWFGEQLLWYCAKCRQ